MLEYIIFIDKNGCLSFLPYKNRKLCLRGNNSVFATLKKKPTWFSINLR